jgi:hypothetical protein
MQAFYTHSTISCSYGNRGAKRKYILKASQNATLEEDWRFSLLRTTADSDAIAVDRFEVESGLLMGARPLNPKAWRCRRHEQIVCARLRSGRMELK